MKEQKVQWIPDNPRPVDNMLDTAPPVPGNMLNITHAYQVYNAVHTSHTIDIFNIFNFIN